MADLNEWQGIGRLGRDIELRYLGNGDAVASFSIACDDSYKDKQSGQKVERTEWVRCVAFRQSAEFLAEWLVKGARVLIKGKLKTREYEKDGVKHYVTEIHADRGTQIIDWPEREPNQTQQQQAPRQQQQRQAPNNQQSAPRQQQQRPSPQQAAPQPQPDFDSFDEDIPF
jgi:single-strand DNA-binding protein